jgi:hypothetical protein
MAGRETEPRDNDGLSAQDEDPSLKSKIPSLKKHSSIPTKKYLSTMSYKIIDYQ